VGLGSPRAEEGGERGPARENNQRGAASVEFVLVFPLALALIALVLFAGWLGMTRVILDHGARETARSMSIPTQADLRTYPDDTYLAEVADAATPLITPTAVVSASGGAPTRNSPGAVTVTYEVTNPVAILLAPFELLGFENAAPRTITLTSTGKARRE
jgi:Flp pilus assembly protein TadG